MSAHESNVASSTIDYMHRDDRNKAQLLAAFVVAERLCPCHDRGRNTRGTLGVHVAGFKVRSFYSYCGLLRKRRRDSEAVCLTMSQFFLRSWEGTFAHSRTTRCKTKGGAKSNFHFADSVPHAKNRSNLPTNKFMGLYQSPVSFRYNPKSRFLRC